MDSLWEVELAVWLDSHNITWSRPKSPLEWVDQEGVIRNYYPDFYLPDLDVYLDPKNPYLMSISRAKFEACSKKASLIWGDLETIKQTVGALGRS